MKVSINSIQKTVNELVTLKNVIELVVQNYGTTAVEITIKGTKQTIPAIDSISGIPVAPFVISAFGHDFDIEFDINFPSGSGNIIINYSTLKIC